MKNILYCIIFLIIYSCKADVKNDDSITSQEVKKKATELNNDAVELIKNFNSVSNKDSLIFVSLSMLEEAIKLDSNNQPSHLNKVNVLVKLKKYNEAIKWIDTIEARFPSNDEIVIFQGLIFEKIGNIDSANIVYNQVKKVFMDRLSIKPNNIAYQLKIIELNYYITNDKNVTLNKLNELLSKLPQNKEILKMIELMKVFNKKEAINAIFSN